MNLPDALVLVMDPYDSGYWCSCLTSIRLNVYTLDCIFASRKISNNEVGVCKIILSYSVVPRRRNLSGPIDATLSVNTANTPTTRPFPYMEPRLPVSRTAIRWINLPTMQPYMILLMQFTSMIYENIP